MRKLVALFLLVLLALSGLPAEAAPSPHLVSLRDAIAALHDEIPANATGADKKERDLLAKLRDILSRDSTSLADDVKTARKLTRTIAKKLEDEPSLTTPLSDALQGLSDEFSALVDALRARVNSLPEGKLRDKATAKLDKYAAIVVALPDTGDPKALANALRKAAKKSKGVEKKVAKAEKKSGIVPCEDGPSTFTASIDTIAFSAVSAKATAHVGGTGFQNVIITAPGPLPGDSSHPDDNSFSVSLGIPNYTGGTGTFDVDGLNVDVRYNAPFPGPGGPVSFVAETGTITIDELDLDNGRVRGSFSVVTPAPIANTFPDKQITGTFDIVCMFVCNFVTNPTCDPTKPGAK